MFVRGGRTSSEAVAALNKLREAVKAEAKELTADSALERAPHPVPDQAQTLRAKSARGVGTVSRLASRSLISEQPAAEQTRRPQTARARISAPRVASKSTLASRRQVARSSSSAPAPAPQPPTVSSVAVPEVALKSTQASRGQAFVAASEPVPATAASTSSVPAVPEVASKTTHASRGQTFVAKVEEEATTIVPTKLKAPELSTAKREKMRGPSSEELELLNAVRQMKEQQLRREKWRSQLDRVLSDQGDKLPVRSTMQLTMPHEFELHTSSRSDCGSPPSRRQQQALVAEQVSAFTKTPKRFRSRPASAQFSPSSVSSSEDLKPTKPVSMELSTEQRAATHRTSVKSTAEREAEEMAAMPKFKALPVNKKVMESGAGSGHYGVPRVQKPQPTQAEGFNLSTSARERGGHTLQTSASEPSFTFKARPYNKPLMEGKAAGLTAVTPRKATKPQSPHLATSARAAIGKPGDFVLPEEDSFASFKARPMPVFSPSRSTPRRVREAAAPITSPRPFALSSEARHEAALMAFRQRLDQEEREEQKARNFKARPMPVGDAWEPDYSKSKVPSENEPFNLETDVRSDVHMLAMQDRVKAAEVEERSMRAFKARSAAVLSKPHFAPSKSTKPLTEIDNGMLYSDARAQERRQWEQAQVEARARRESEHRREEIERMRREVDEIAQLRKRMVPSARPAPVLKAKPFRPHLAHEHTRPESPHLHTKGRSAIRAA